MEKNLKRLVLEAIYCMAFFLPIVLSSPANSQSLEWVNLLGTTSHDYGVGVAVDTSGNIYVTGYTYGNLGDQTNAGNIDAFLAKYDDTGTIQWVRLLGTTSNAYGLGVAVDTSGNIYVTGYTDGNLDGQTNAGNYDVFLAKYDGTGTRQWVKLLGTALSDYGYGVAVDTSGNIYVTGYTFGNLDSQTNAGNDDIFLAKYDGTGAKQWVKLLGTAANDEGQGVAVDTSGNIYVTGGTGGNLDGQTNAGNYDVFLAKYDGTGAKQWVRLLGTALNDEGYGVTVDTSGNIYVTGYTYGNLDSQTNAGNDDIFLAKYDGTGAKQWVRLLGTASSDEGLDVAADPSGNIYVTGYTFGNLDSQTNAGNEDAFLAKYNSSGTLQGVKLLGTALNDEGDGVTVDTSGNIYVAGTTFGNLDGETTAGQGDAFLAKFKSSFPWEIFYPAFIKKQ